MNILGEAVASDQCEVVALCDVDDRQLKAVEKLGEKTSDQPQRYADFRELLDREKPEICIVATPDHWHPLIMIAAVKAGRYVYAGKAHRPYDSRGPGDGESGSRHGKGRAGGHASSRLPHNVSGMEFLKSGKAGKIGMVRAFVHYPGNGPEKPRPNEDAPREIDWDMWCGPVAAAVQSGHSSQGISGSFLDYANGTLGDWGIHWMDQILWWTDDKWPRAFPRSAVATSRARPVTMSGADDRRPDTQVAQFEFESFTAVWEHRQYAGNTRRKAENVGCYFYGTNGTFHQAWQKGGHFIRRTTASKSSIETRSYTTPTTKTSKNCLRFPAVAIKENRRAKCDIEVAHRSTNMSFSACSRSSWAAVWKWDGDKELVIDDAEANKLLSREYRKPWEYPV